MREEAPAHRPLVPPSPLASDNSTVLRLAVWILLYSIPALTALQPISEWDTGWHLRTGQWIVEHGSVPTTDPFSSFGQGKAWVAYSWLFGLMFHALYQAFGLTGILLYRIVLSLTVVAALHRLIARREVRFGVVAGLMGAAVVALAPLLMGERPWLFTILFSIVTLDVILSLREGATSKWVWLLPLVYAFWANLHIQFVHGLLLLGVACVAPLLNRLLQRHEQDAHAGSAGSRGWWTLVGLTTACFLTTFVNPYHVRLYGVILEYSRHTETYALFPELKALEFRQLPDWAILGLTGAAAFALGRRGRVSAFDVLLLATGAYFAFHSRHDAWLIVPVSAVLITGGSHSLGEKAGRAATSWWKVAVVATAVVVVTGVNGWKRNLTEAGLQEKLTTEYPVAAADFLRLRGYAGPLYNPIDWGGYLIWRLPEMPVAIDGRTNLHGDQRVKQFADTWDGSRGWEDDPDLCAARVVVLQTRAPLTALLRTDARFRVVHEDALAVVFIATTSP